MSTGPPSWAGRHQAVRRLAHPAGEQRIDQGAAGSAAAAEQHANRPGIERERQNVEQRHEHQAPTGQRQRIDDRRQPLRGEQADEQQHAERQEPGGRTRHGRRRNN